MWFKLKRLKQVIKNNHLVCEARDPLNSSLMDREKKATNELKKRLHVEELALRQKSRVMLKLGDNNTPYFHHVMRDRSRNKIE